jgi:translation initiation factor IF-2
LNKSDCTDSEKLITWITDYEEFMGALQEDSSYLATLSKSIVIHLSEFYEQLKYIKVSAKTGFGLEEVLKAIQE